MKQFWSFFLMFLGIVGLLYGQSTSPRPMSRKQYARAFQQVTEQAYQLELGQQGTAGYKDSLSTMAAQLDGALGALLADPRSAKADLSPLLNRPSLRGMRSQDGRLYAFSISEEMGGTYAPYFVSLYVVPEKGAAASSALGQGAIVEIKDIAPGAYLVADRFMGCMTCEYYTLSLVRWVDGKLDIGTVFGTAGPNEADGAFTYDPESRVLSCTYTQFLDAITDTPEEEAEEGSEVDAAEPTEASPSGGVQYHRITFQWDGSALQELGEEVQDSEF